MFGTTGIRNKFATFDETEKKFTPSIALKLGLAIGTYMEGQPVVVGRDIRTAAIPIEYALTSGLISAGCEVKLIGMVTTPTLAMSIDILDAKCGVMITASHNPPEYIGIKLWNRYGLGFNQEQEKEIERIYTSNDFIKKEWDEIGPITEINRINEIHVQEVLKKIKAKDIKRKFSIIIDPGNGSSCEIVPLLMNHLNFKFITLNSQPDGRFPGRLSEPSSKNLQDLCDFANFSKTTELGIALDGDADRVVFVDGNGQVIEPIRILAFLAREYVKDEFPDPKDRENLIIATPINSSRVLEKILEPLGVKVIRTEVGDIKVSLAIAKHGGILGGETAGTYMWPEFHYGPDVLMTIAMLLKFLSKYNMEFKDIIASIPNFPFIKTEIHLKKDYPFSREDYEDIARKLSSNLEENHHEQLEISYLDGLHINTNKGWVLIRKSGTTPILRISCESNSDITETEEILEIANKTVMEFIKKKDSSDF